MLKKPEWQEFGYIVYREYPSGILKRAQCRLVVVCRLNECREQCKLRWLGVQRKLTDLNLAHKVNQHKSCPSLTILGWYFCLPSLCPLMMKCFLNENSLGTRHLFCWLFHGVIFSVFKFILTGVPYASHHYIERPTFVKLTTSAADTSPF